MDDETSLEKEVATLIVQTLNLEVRLLNPKISCLQPGARSEQALDHETTIIQV